MFENRFDILDMIEGLLARSMSLSAFGLIMYILGAVGAYTIAKRRNIRHAWLSWLPVGIYWIWGCISDQYQHVTNGKVTSRRKVLLGLSIAQLAPIAAIIYMYVKAFVQIAMPGSAHIPEWWMMLDREHLVMMFLLYLAVSAALLVFTCMSLYDLFRSCDPDRAVLFLVISILISQLGSAFIFAVRKLDLGMPLRKSTDPEHERPYEL